MNRFAVGLVALTAHSTPCLPAASAQAPSLTLVGLTGETKRLSTAELGALPQADAIVVGKDSTRITFRGPTLRSVVTLVGAPAGHDLRGPNMLVAIVAEAADSYRVAYMLSEIDSQFGAREAIVALLQDGKPLPAADAPFRIVMPGEEHRARWIRQVVRLRLVKIGN